MFGPFISLSSPGQNKKEITDAPDYQTLSIDDFRHYLEFSV